MSEDGEEEAKVEEVMERVEREEREKRQPVTDSKDIVSGRASMKRAVDVRVKRDAPSLIS